MLSFQEVVSAISVVMSRCRCQPVQSSDRSCTAVPILGAFTAALHWPARRLLAVADLHLEKGSSYAVNALKLLPRHDTRQTLAMLSILIDSLEPKTVMCLGDSFHDREAVARLPKQERAEIESLTRRAPFVWIAGNHDPGPPPQGWGVVAEEIADGPLGFRHEARLGLPDGGCS